MTKTKVKYYLDETDQIEVDGHTLSRLYLAEAVPHPFFTNMDSEYAIFGEDNTGREMGGYIESLSIMPKEVDSIDYPAWVHADSKVYGNSKLAPGITVHNSTIVDSKVTNYTDTSNVFDSTIVNSTVDTVRNSTITDSTITKPVQSSTIENSTIRSQTYNSTVKNSTLTGTKSSHIKRANLENVTYHGTIAGTFSNIQQNDIKTHSISLHDDHKDNYDYIYQVNLFEGPNGKFAMSDNDVWTRDLPDNPRVPNGDIELDEVYGMLTREIDGGTLGTPGSIKKVKSIQERQVLDSDLVLTDADLDFGDSGMQR